LYTVFYTLTVICLMNVPSDCMTTVRLPLVSGVTERPEERVWRGHPCCRRAARATEEAEMPYPLITARPRVSTYTLHFDHLWWLYMYTHAGLPLAGNTACDYRHKHPEACVASWATYCYITSAVYSRNYCAVVKIYFFFFFTLIYFFFFKFFFGISGCFISLYFACCRDKSCVKTGLNVKSLNFKLFPLCYMSMYDVFIFFCYVLLSAVLVKLVPL